MPYFRERYSEVRFPVAEGNSPGFREAQLGAAWAISSHFTQRTEPALVTMPTGSGKTAVLILIAFMLRSERTLVLTPNVLVRDQIFEEFKTLKTLLRVGALPQNTPGPNIKVVGRRITTEQDWENLRAFDVVVATPHSLSPGLAPIPSPPVDLFDLILVDEAHHSPARTWSELLEAFPSARKVLFTATPFRRDRSEIKAKFVYAYSLRRAYEEGVFGNIRYIPVSDPGGGDVPVDAALAIKAMEALRQDRESGLDHYLMVRTDSKKKANELRKIYSDHTDLNLRLVHSGYSYKRIRETIKKLREGELDGIICVAMLGEGFDLPQLKIAAIHAPHKSLEVTLQFIGRFARTSREKIGEAKFLATPNDLKLETERLYREDAVWQEIVANLSASRIDAEVGLQYDLSTFSTETVAQEDLSDLSLYSLEPYQHVKIYSVRNLDLAAPIRLPPSFSIVYENYSEELSARIVITRETEQPKWTDQERFERAEYDLFVLYYNQAASLLFINSSRRSVGIYEAIAASVSGKSHRILPLFKINRVLRELRSIVCFNLGMRNRANHASVETYRIMAGSQTQKGIGKTTGRLFNRGHVFAKVDGAESSTTIGYSSGSKVWSSGYAKIPEQIDWCKVIAEKILNDQEFSTGSELDDLPLSSALIGIPTVIAIDWHEEFYLRPFDVRYINDETEIRCSILDCDLTVEHVNGDSILLKISSEGFSVPVVYKNDGGRFFEKLESNGSRLHAMLPTEVVDLVDCLNDLPLSFYTPDLSRVCGEEKFPGWVDAPPYDIDRIEVWDWKDLGVDIECEYETDGKQPAERMSIHAYLATRLREGYEVVFYDHGSGEISDFLTLKVEGQTVVIALYHCKASNSASPGERVADIYEVAGQVVKSTLWLKRPSDLQKKIEQRMKRGSRFVKGTSEDLRRIIAIAATKGARYEIVLVQPGISAVKLTEVGLSILGAAHGYVNSAGLFEMRVISSL